MNPSLIRSYRIRIGLVLFAAAAVLLVLNTGYKTINTIHYLDAVESERDHWQRPAEIVQALSLKDGSFVVDVGSGSDILH